MLAPVRAGDPPRAHHRGYCVDGTAVRPASPAPGSAVSYAYDARGTCLRLTIPAATPCTCPASRSPPPSGGAHRITGTRFIQLPGGGAASGPGTGHNYDFETSDQHGTSILTLDHTLQNPVWRQYTPYGQPRADRPAEPGPTTTATSATRSNAADGLTTIGARRYDPVTGRFLSPDPVLEAGDPTQMGGYAYAADNPVNASDPTGLMLPGNDGGGTDTGTPTERRRAEWLGPGHCNSVASRLDGGCTVLPAPASGTGNGWDFLAGVGSDLANVADEAYCVSSPLGCAMSFLGGTAPSQLYQSFITGQGIDTRSSAYFGGEVSGDILLTAVGGAAGAAAGAAEDAGSQAAALQNAVEQRYAQVVAEQSIRQRGPVLSGAMNTRTGDIFFGQNTGIPDLLHPDHQVALDQFEGPGAAGKGIPGAHSEVNAVNEGLFTNPGSQISDYIFYSLRLRGALQGEPIEMCPNCASILGR